MGAARRGAWPTAAIVGGCGRRDGLAKFDPNWSADPKGRLNWLAAFATTRPIGGAILEQ